jgi:hypothetical protein
MEACKWPGEKMKATKVCVKCCTEKPRSDDYFFYRNRARGWFSSWCKDCAETHRESVKDHLNELQRDRRGLKPCRVCGTTEKTKGTTYCDKCFKAKKAKTKRADKCVYKSRLRKATPIWANKELIREVYSNKPEGCHVDHVVPIRGETVCGLHVVENLQYLTAAENMEKGNRFQSQ